MESNKNNLGIKLIFIIFCLSVPVLVFIPFFLKNGLPKRFFEVKLIEFISIYIFAFWAIYMSYSLQKSVTLNVKQNEVYLEQLNALSKKLLKVYKKGLHYAKINIDEKIEQELVFILKDFSVHLSLSEQIFKKLNISINEINSNYFSFKKELTQSTNKKININRLSFLYKKISKEIMSAKLDLFR